MLTMFLYYMVAMNLSLAVFNLLPVPPFDGSRIALLFLPQRLYFRAMRYERYIMLAVLALVFLGLLDAPLSWLVNGMWRLMLHLTGFVELLWGIEFLPEVLTFKIEDFEGPLDLLLYLVGKNKMNLYDVNIMELIEQYTAAIREMQQDRMEISSEFIDMAAHLVQMKSALLLPRSPEAERMKAELTGRLIEYSACKEVAAQLGSRARDLYTVAREPMPLVGAAEYTRRHDPNWLVQAWFNLMGRSTRKKKPTQEKFEPLVTAPFVSVASRVSHMLRGLLKGSLQKWASCSATRKAAAQT